MPAAIVLAAGDSTRMGTPKALLPDAEGRPFIARIVRAFADAGVTAVAVVTGVHHDAIRDAVLADRPGTVPRFVPNPDRSRGPLSSLWIGLDAVTDRDLDAVLMTLVDVPLTRPSTIRAVVDAWRRTGAPVVRPAIGDRHGHPVLFDRVLFEELRRAPLEGGAKVVVHAHLGSLLNVQVDDEGCLFDVDTADDYAEMLARFGSQRS